MFAVLALQDSSALLHGIHVQLIYVIRSCALSFSDLLSLTLTLL